MTTGERFKELSFDDIFRRWSSLEVKFTFLTPCECSERLGKLGGEI